MDYCYITAPENHYDLEDCFGGVYDTEKKAWRFDIAQKEEVLNFLYCSGDEENEEEDITECLNKYARAKPKRSRSVHRSRSACTDNKSSDSEFELEEEPVKHETSGKKQTEQMCVVAEKKQTAQKQKVEELKKLIK
jgi:hypothetical protein